jgi:hypothetical protein
MSLKRMLVTSSAAIALMAPVSGASAQSSSRQKTDRPNYDRPANVDKLPRTPKVKTDTANKPDATAMPAAAVAMPEPTPTPARLPAPCQG